MDTDLYAKQLSEIADKQREEITARVAATLPDPVPEVRWLKITGAGKAIMYFTRPLDVPVDAIELINNDRQARLLRKDLPPDTIRIDVLVLRQTEDFELTEPLLTDWKLTRLDEKGLEIDLNFAQPLSISQEGQPDLLFVELSFGQFKDSDGNNLPESNLKRKEIPPQFASKSDEARVQ